jgi:Amj-like protein
VTDHLHVPAGWFLPIAALLYMFAQALQMGTGAARLAGVRAHRVATGLTLFNLFATFSRLLSLFYMPLIAALADRAVDRRSPDEFEGAVRVIIFAATIGAAIGGLLLPTAARLLQRGIDSFERRGSVLAAMSRLFVPRTAISALGEVRVPRFDAWSYSPRNLPKGFLIWNVVVMGFWVTGPLSAYYAGVQLHSSMATAISLSGLITGVATVTLTLIVDPTAALITDQAAAGKRSIDDLKAMLVYLVLTTIVGTLLSQLLLGPAASVIAYVARMLTNAATQI